LANNFPISRHYYKQRNFSFLCGSASLRLSFLILNLSRDFKSQIQRAFGGFAADHRRLLRAYAFDKMLQFEFERFLLSDGHRLAHDFFSSELADDGGVFANAKFRGQNFFQNGTFFLVVPRDAINKSLLHAIIERDVTRIGRAAEHANFPHPFRADAAGGKIGNAAVGKTQSRVGDVFARAQNGNAHGVHALDRRFDKRENHVEIVNHQIEHDADVRRARGIRRKAMALDELRLGRDAFNKFENGIEPLDVADLQNQIFFLREFAKFGGLRGIIGHRFFDKDVFAAREQSFCDFKMRGRRRDDVQRVGIFGGFSNGIKIFYVVLRGKFFCGFGVRVENSREFYVAGFFQFGINACVMLAERTGAEHGNTDFLI
jgi:hypothetical protein